MKEEKDVCDVSEEEMAQVMAKIMMKHNPELVDCLCEELYGPDCKEIKKNTKRAIKKITKEVI